MAKSVPHPGPSLPNAHPWAPSPESQEEVSLIGPALWVPGRGGQLSRACSEMHKSILSSERVKSRQKLSTTGAKHTEPPMAAMFRPGLNRPEEASHRHLTLVLITPLLIPAGRWSKNLQGGRSLCQSWPSLGRDRAEMSGSASPWGGSSHHLHRNNQELLGWDPFLPSCPFRIHWFGAVALAAPGPSDWLPTCAPRYAPGCLASVMWDPQGLPGHP